MRVVSDEAAPAHWRRMAAARTCWAAPGVRPAAAGLDMFRDHVLHRATIKELGW